jgi:hypothetical protein
VKPGDVVVCRSAPALGELKVKVRGHEIGSVETDRRVRAEA